MALPKSLRVFGFLYNMDHICYPACSWFVHGKSSRDTISVFRAHRPGEVISTCKCREFEFF